MADGTFDDRTHGYLDGLLSDGSGKPNSGKNKPDKTLGELDGNGARVEAKTVKLENFTGMGYDYIYNQMKDVSENIASGYQDTLHTAHKNIQDALTHVKATMAKLDGERGWQGQTHEAAMNDLQMSYVEPDEASKAAFALGTLSEYYSQIMSTNKHNILRQSDEYQKDLVDYPESADEVRRYFGKFAEDVMRELYSPQITDLTGRLPGVDWQPPASPASQTVVQGSGKAGFSGDGNGDGDYQDGYADGYADGQKGKGDGGSGGGGGNQGSGSGSGSGTETGSESANGSSGETGNKPSFKPSSPQTADVVGDGSSDGGGNGSGSGGGSNGSSNGSGGGNAPAFSPPNLKASGLEGGSSEGGGSGSGSGGGSDGSSNGSGSGSGDTPKPTFNPPSLGGLESAGLGGSGDGSASNGSSGSGRPKFDPSSVLTDPKSIAAAHQLLDNPKTAEAAKKLFGDPKLADAAKTLFGDNGHGLLGNPKALDAAKTLFGNPDAADAVKTLFGDPDTAKSAQQLLKDPHLGDLTKGLKDFETSHPGGTSDMDEALKSLLDPSATDGLSGADGSRDLTRALAGQSGLSNAGLLSGLAGGSGGSDFMSGIMDGVGQIVQAVQQAAAPQPPGFGGPGMDGVPGGLPEHPVGAAGAGGAHGGGGAGAGPGSLHSLAASAPIAAATHAVAAHSVALTPATDAAPAGAGAAGGPPAGGGGHGGGGRGGEAKDHKGNKALRGTGNGEVVVGQSDAVVPVIGDDDVDGAPGWSFETS